VLKMLPLDPACDLVAGAEAIAHAVAAKDG
jgi:hypothetical protein